MPALEGAVVPLYAGEGRPRTLLVARQFRSHEWTGVGGKLDLFVAVDVTLLQPVCELLLNIRSLLLMKNTK